MTLQGSPDTGRSKPHNKAAQRLHRNDITPHRRWRKGSVCSRIPEAGILLTPPDELEDVAVEMERVLAVVGIVQDDFYDLAFLKHKGVGALAVEGWV